MNESYSNASVSSTSSLNSSHDDTEDDQTIASILAEEEQHKADRRLGKRLSHLDSIPVFDPCFICEILFSPVYERVCGICYK